MTVQKMSALPAAMKGSTEEILLGGPPPPAAPITDGDLEYLLWQIEKALKSLPALGQRLFAAEFCGDEIPSVMDDPSKPPAPPRPKADEFVLPLPSWEEA